MDWKKQKTIGCEECQERHEERVIALGLFLFVTQDPLKREIQAEKGIVDRERQKHLAEARQGFDINNPYDCVKKRE